MKLLEPFLFTIFLTMTISLSSQSGNEVYWYAMFPGGSRVLDKYLEDSCKLSREDQLIFGKQKVVVTYKIDTSGKVTDITVINCREEYLRKRSISILSNMPIWMPAMKNGVKVEETRKLVMKFN